MKNPKWLVENTVDLPLNVKKQKNYFNMPICLFEF